jgi:AraC family transcriptional regulator
LRIASISAIERYLISGMSNFFDGIARMRRLCSRIDGTRCSTKHMKDLIAANRALRVRAPLSRAASPRFVETVARQVGLPSRQGRRLPQGPFRIDRRLETLGGLLAEETENRCRLGPAYFEWLASALAATVLSRLHAPRGVPIHSGIRRAIEYIELHFTEPVSLAELAKQAQLSRSYFALRFEQVTGYTPHHYLLLVRLGHARKLLAEAKLSLPEIAAASGFSDQAHMSRLFQRFFGTTPAAFRRSQRQL